MISFYDVAQSPGGGSIPNATVTVLKTGTSTLATLFSDNGVTPLSNPFQADGQGRIVFFAANGLYDISYSGPNLVLYAKNRVQLFDGSSLFSLNAQFSQAVTGNGADQTVSIFTLPANSMTATGALKLEVQYVHTGVNLVTYKFLVGASTISTYISPSTAQDFFSFKLRSTGVGSQKGYVSKVINFVPIIEYTGALAIDTTVNQDIKMIANVANPDTVTANIWTVETPL